MKTPIDNISKGEIEKMKQWLQEQTLLENFTSQEVLRLVLCKLFEFEQRLKKIEYNQQTHWTS